MVVIAIVILIGASFHLTLILRTSLSTDSTTSATQIVVYYNRADNGGSDDEYSRCLKQAHQQTY